MDEKELLMNLVSSIVNTMDTSSASKVMSEINPDLINGIVKKDKVFMNKYQTLAPAKMSTQGLMKLFVMDYLIKVEKAYGKDILTHFGEVYTQSVWNPSHGTLYPLIKNMLANGEIIEDGIDKTKKYFKLTESGLREYVHIKEEMHQQIDDMLLFYASVKREIYDEVV